MQKPSTSGFSTVLVALAVIPLANPTRADSLPPERIEGVVLLPDGKPAADAPVVLSHIEVYGQTRTSADGTFRLSVDRQQILAKSGRAAWRAVGLASYVEGLGIGFRNLRDVKAGEPITIQLVEDVPIRGRVLDQQGRAVAGAELEVIMLHDLQGGVDAFLAARRDSPFRVRHHLSHSKATSTARVFSALGGDTELRPQAVLSDDQGRFELAGLGGERVVFAEIRHPDLMSQWIFVVTRKDLEARWKPGPLSEQSRRYQNLGWPMPIVYGAEFRHLGAPGLSVTGTLVAADSGEPVPGMSVAGNVGLGARALAKSDVAGKFVLHGLKPEGKLQISVHNPGSMPWLNGSRTIRVTADMRPMKVQLKLDRGVKVSGRVLDEAGQPVPGTVGYLGARNNAHLKKLSNNFNTRYVIPTKQDGGYLLVVPPGYGVLTFVARDRRMYDTARAEDFGMKLGKNRGEVEFSSTNRGIVSAGQFTALKRIDPTTDGEELKVDLLARSGAVVRVQLTRADGAPVRRFETRFPYRGGFDFALSEGAWEGNAFELRGLEAGARRVVLFWTPDRKWAVVRELSMPEDGGIRNEQVQLHACGTITGRLTDEKKNPLTEWSLFIDSEDLSKANDKSDRPAERISFATGQVATDINGYFRILGVPPNVNVEIMAVPPEGEEQVQKLVKTVRLRPGQELDLNAVRISHVTEE